MLHSLAMTCIPVPRRPHRAKFLHERREADENFYFRLAVAFVAAEARVLCGIIEVKDERKMDGGRVAHGGWR